MTGWTFAWIIWILMFFAIEIPAIRNDTEGDTLSEHFAKWFRVDTLQGKLAWSVVWAAFGIWMLLHILLYGTEGGGYA